MRLQAGFKDNLKKCWWGPGLKRQTVQKCVCNYSKGLISSVLLLLRTTRSCDQLTLMIYLVTFFPLINEIIKKFDDLKVWKKIVAQEGGKYLTSLFLFKWIEWMLNYLLCFLVFSVLLTADVKHILPRAKWLQN